MMLGHYPTDILISLSIFFLALWMLLIFRTNIILIIFSLELLLLANILGFIITSVYLDDITGELFGLFILVIGAIETAISLSIVLSYYRLTNKNINNLINSNDFFSLSALTVAAANVNVKPPKEAEMLALDTVPFVLSLLLLFYLVYCCYWIVLRTPRFIVQCLYSLGHGTNESFPNWESIAYGYLLLTDYFNFRYPIPKIPYPKFPLAFCQKYLTRAPLSADEFEAYNKAIRIKRRPFLDKIISKTDKLIEYQEERYDQIAGGIFTLLSCEWLLWIHKKKYNEFCKTYLKTPMPEKRPSWHVNAKDSDGTVNYTSIDWAHYKIITEAYGKTTVLGSRIIERIELEKRYAALVAQNQLDRKELEKEIENLKEVIENKDLEITRLTILLRIK